MRRFPIQWMLLLSLLLVACHAPSPVTTSPMAGPVSAQSGRPLFSGSVIQPSDYRTQAIASNLVASASVSLIDPATNQVKGTGITNAAGSFTVMALPTFTPTLNGLYLLEATKARGGAGTVALSLRTLVSLSGTGWTSISGTQVTISTVTTAIALLYRYKGLGYSDVIGKVAYDATTGRSTAIALNTAIPDSTVRLIESRVQQALAQNLDPMQVLHPAIDGTLAINTATNSINMLLNPSFENGLDYWYNGGSSGSAITTATADVTSPYDMAQSGKVTVTGSGDAWFGQGGGNTSTFYSSFYLNAGQTYTFSVYARGASGGEHIRLAVSGQIPGFLELVSSSFTLTTAWQRYSFTFTAPASSPIGVVFVRVGSSGGQVSYPETLWVDAAQLEVGPNPSPYAGAPGKLLYDSTVTPASASSTVTYGPGHNGGTGLVLDAGINLVSNGHAQNGTASYTVPNGGTLALTTAYGAPPNGPGSSVFQYTHDNRDNTGENVVIPVSVQPNTNYAMSVWLYFPSVGNPASMSNDFYVTLDAGGNGARLADTSQASVTFNTWQKQTLVVNSGPNSTLYVMPLDLWRTNAIGAFTMLQVEQGTAVHPYAGGPGQDRYTIDPRYIPRNAGTIEFWCQPFFDASDTRFDNNSSGGAQLLGLVNNVDNTIMSLFKTGNSLTFLIYDNGQSYTAVWSPTSPLWTANSWHHMAMSWGAPAGTTLYFDGQAVASNSYPGGIYVNQGSGTSYGNLYLAGRNNNGNNAPNWTLDQFRIYDYPRSPQEIARDYLGVQSLPAL